MNNKKLFGKLTEKFGGVLSSAWTVSLAAIMLIGGTGNTLFVKLQDMERVKGLGDQPPRLYEHPFTQSIFMFAGMTMCLLFFYPPQVYSIIKTTYKKYQNSNSINNNENDNLNEEGEELGETNQEHQPINPKKPTPNNQDQTQVQTSYHNDLENNNNNNSNLRNSNTENQKIENEKKDDQKKEKPEAPLWYYMIPAYFDLIATALLFAALLNIQASVYQMLRGSVVVFSCIVSIMLLGSHRYIHHWLAVCLVLIGGGIVGSVSFIYPSESGDVAKNPALGIGLILLSQFVQSLQLVAEEKLLSGYKVIPLQCAGWEGIWGIMGGAVVLFVSYFIPGNDFGNRLENCPAAVIQMFRNPVVLLTSLLLTFGCFLLNFAGISLTQRLDNTARMTIDCLRTFSIWVVSMIIGWESFKWLQVLGFGVMIVGTLVFNDVITIPYYNDYYQELKKEDIEDDKRRKERREEKKKKKKEIKKKKKKLKEEKKKQLLEKNKNIGYNNNNGSNDIIVEN